MRNWLLLGRILFQRLDYPNLLYHKQISIHNLHHHSMIHYQNDQWYCIMILSYPQEKYCCFIILCTFYLNHQVILILFYFLSNLHQIQVDLYLRFNLDYDGEECFLCFLEVNSLIDFLQTILPKSSLIFDIF